MLRNVKSASRIDVSLAGRIEMRWARCQKQRAHFLCRGDSGIARSFFDICHCSLEGEAENYGVIARPAGPWQSPGKLCGPEPSTRGLPEGELPEGQERPPWGASGCALLAMTWKLGPGPSFRRGRAILESPLQDRDFRGDREGRSYAFWGDYRIFSSAQLSTTRTPISVLGRWYFLMLTLL